MGRPPNDVEKNWLKAHFPKVDVTKTVVTGDATPTYNCLAWTLGITNTSVWPGEKESDFDNLYRRSGYVRAPDGPIAAWGTARDKMTHGCISGPGHGPRWESKLGNGPRIEHGLTELEGVEYGAVRFFYAKEASFLMADRDSRITGMLDAVALSRPQIEQLAAEANAVPASVRRRFEGRYAAWKRTWSRLDIVASSNPETVRHSAEFVRLAAMGPQVLPLVLERISNQGEDQALQLYDAIQLNEPLRVQIFQTEEVLGGERYRALVTIRRWLSR